MYFKLLRKIIQMSKYTFYGICLQLILGGVLLASSSEAQRKSLDNIYISVNIDNLKLSDALKVLSDETDFNFSYNDLRINEDKVISAKANNQSMTELLKQISKDYGLKFKRINDNIYVSKKERVGSDVVEEITAIFQERQITGKVTSSEDGSGLPGVNVIVQGSTNGTITDIDGKYVLNVPDGAILEFSSVGFMKEIVDVGSRSVIDMVLIPDVTQLSEIVVIGYGTREKKDLTGAISVMDSKDIQKSIAMAPEFAMQGQMAGVLVTSPSGLATDRPTVRIRGVSTFGIADPLYVIDGVPITEFGAGAEQSAAVVRDIRGDINIMSLINPDDIESISVLKDASSAAIYGVRASNGVILITTKKGKEGMAKIDFNYRIGVQNFPNKYNVLNTSDYTQLYQEVYAANPNYTLPGYFNPDSINTTNRYDNYLGNKPTFDWQDPFIQKNAINTDANIKVYGGTASTNYYVSAGYSQIEAPIKINSQDRYTFATNINTKAAKWIEVGLNYRMSYSEVIDQASTLDGSISAPPWQPLLFKDDYYPINNAVEGKYGLAVVNDPVTVTPNPNHPMNGGTDPDVPPYDVTWAKKYGVEQEGNRLSSFDSRLNENTYNMIRNLGSAYLKLTLYKGLTLRGSFSMDYYHNQRSGWSSIDNVYYSPTPGNPYAVGDGSSLGNITYRDSYNQNMVSELTLDWNHSFGDHNIIVTLNAMDQQYGYRFLQTSSEQVIQDNPDKRLITESEKYTTVGEMLDKSALQGFMARASYNYASKYYIDATIRRDGSSKFAPDYRWGTFPSVALAWRMSSENFMSGLNWINDIKWRFGWGQLGNQETKSFAYLSTVNLSPQYAYGSGLGDGYGFVTNGLFLPDFPTEDLSWETSTTTNFGFDAIFLKNRLNATVEYYNRLTEDILQSAAFASSVGNYNNPIINIASVKNSGFEFQVGWRDQIGEVEYYGNANFTTVKNEVMKVWNDQPFGGETGRIEEGYPVNYLWGFKTGGIYQSQEEVDNRQAELADNQTTPDLVSAGDMYFLDVHGDPNPEEGYDFYSPDPDGKINLNDRTFIGNTIPEYFYGFTLGVNWKGFDFSGFFQGIGGVYKYNWALVGGVRMDGQGNNQWTNVLNRWTPSNKNTWDPNDRANSLPRAVIGDPAGNNRASDRFADKAGYMRLRNLTLGYNVPSALLQKSGYVERVRVYVTGSNLMTLTKWAGIDPENDQIPIPVTWSFGVNATF